MSRSRLSSVMAAVRALLQTKHGISLRLQQVLADRRLVRQDVIMHEELVRQQQQQIRILTDTVRQLDQESKSRQQQIEVLEAQIETAKVSLKGMAAQNATQLACVNAMLAHYVSFTTKVTSGTDAAQKAIEDLI